jgi:hypothetical protein
MNRYVVKVTVATYHTVELDAYDVDCLDDEVADYVSALGHDTSEVDIGYSIEQMYDLEEPQ